jgi:hypothetical protein
VELEGEMAVARRRLLAAATVVPASFVAGRVVRAAGAAVDGAARAARPRPDGTSMTRCARCGARDHAMLDPRCRMAPQVRSTRTGTR